MTLSKYTLELKTLISDPNFNLFDFEYKFYNEENKKEFQELFQEYYYFHEIGFETVARFKRRLQNKLNVIYPYYRQLYETELATKGITFLLNKDLEETFSRELINDNTSNMNSKYLGSATNDFKESNLDNGTASTNLSSGSLTTVNNTVDSASNENITENIGNNTSKEETKLISKGNIGTTSSATLLKEWRSVLININELIIEECNDLFMGVY